MRQPFGIYVLSKAFAGETAFEKFYEKFKEQKDYLNSARPTAVNLSWALNRMEALCLKAGREKGKPVKEVVELLHREAVAIKEEDTWVCKTIGEFGLSLVKPGDGILTIVMRDSLPPANTGQPRLPFILDRREATIFECLRTRPDPFFREQG